MKICGFPHETAHVIAGDYHRVSTSVYDLGNKAYRGPDVSKNWVSFGEF